MIVSFFLYLRPSGIKKLRQFQSVGRRSDIVGVRNDNVCVTGYWAAKISEINEYERKQLADVKETIVTENTYKAIPYNVLKTYFLPKVMF